VDGRFLKYPARVPVVLERSSAPQNFIDFPARQAYYSCGILIRRSESKTNPRTAGLTSFVAIVLNLKPLNP
jgi:hypothetical protein